MADALPVETPVHAETFAEGDPVWITDGSAGSPRAAVITSAWAGGELSERMGRLYAESVDRLPGDSRIIEWAIPWAAVARMVSRRGGRPTEPYRS